MKVFLVCCLISFVTFTFAGPAVDSKTSDGHENLVQQPNEYNQFEEGLLSKLNSKCAERDVSSCVMLKLVTYMNRLMKKASIEVNSDLEITQTTTTVDLAQTARSLPADINTMSEEAQLTQLITNKIWNFVRSRQLRYRIVDDADLVVSANPDKKDGTLNIGLSIKAAQALEGRGKKNNMGPLLAAGMMKVGLIGALAFKALVLLVGKALIVSKIALLLATIIGLKKLFSQEKKHVTYEVVSHPHHTHSHVESSGHDSYGGGWGRSLSENAQDMAYKAQKPQTVSA